MTTVRQAMNNGSLTGLASFFQAEQIGDVLRKHLKFDLRGKVPAASPSVLATLLAIPQDQNAPAATILRAYGRSTSGGSGTPGELTVSAYGVTPAANHIAVAPNGSLVVLAADDWTSVDVEYMPVDGDVVVLTGLPVVPGTGVCAIPAKFAGSVVYLLAAAATAGTVVGNEVILVPNNTAPTTGEANLNAGTGTTGPAGKSEVLFCIADAVTTANLTLYVAKGVLQGSTDLDAYLQSDAGDII